MKQVHDGDAAIVGKSAPSREQKWDRLSDRVIVFINAMKTNSLLPLVSAIALSGSVFAQDTGEKREPVTISQALKIGEEGLTEYTGLSEVGQDQAAELYATAKRITTEQALGEKNLQLVIDLDAWRTVIAQCRRS